MHLSKHPTIKDYICDLDTGDIYSLKVPIGKKARKLKQNTSVLGYKRVTIITDSGQSNYWSHKFALECKLERDLLKFPQEVTDHINGIKTDNRACNLDAVTIQENTQRGNVSKLTPELVTKIRQDHRLLRDIADQYQVDESLVSRIKNRRTWKNI